MKFKDKLNKFLAEKVNIIILKGFPRHSIRYAKKYFNNRPIDVIEIGTYEGFNARNMFENFNINKMYLIDPYKEYSDYSESEDFQTQKNLSKVEALARKRLQKYSDKIVWIRKYSDEAIKEIEEKVDFIYIDGNHEYEYVLKDIKNYYPLLKIDGIISGHDVANFKGVGKALIEFCSENKIDPTITRTDFFWEKYHE